MISRGRVRFVDLNPMRGREQAGRRPVLVVSADLINRQPLVVAVVVGTGVRRGLAGPSGQRPVRVAESCSVDRYRVPVLPAPLARSLEPASRQLRPAGVLPERRMTEVDQALRLVLDL